MIPGGHSSLLRSSGQEPAAHFDVLPITHRPYSSEDFGNERPEWRLFPVYLLSSSVSSRFRVSFPVIKRALAAVTHHDRKADVIADRTPAGVEGRQPLH